jgi:hypothetical protein
VTRARWSSIVLRAGERKKKERMVSKTVSGWVAGLLTVERRHYFAEAEELPEVSEVIEASLHRLRHGTAVQRGGEEGGATEKKKEKK